jgi:hypothetical protein
MLVKRRLHTAITNTARRAGDVAIPRASRCRPGARVPCPADDPTFAG